MPKVRRQNLPQKLMDHLANRVKMSEISADELIGLHDYPAIQQPGRPTGRSLPNDTKRGVERFGKGVEQRRKVTARLLEIWRLAESTGKLDRVIIFGSYVTAKAEPRDVDIILMMKDDFDVETCSPSIRPLFDHSQADHRFGVSIFWIRPAMLLMDESLDSFIARWQLKRDGGRRGILEVAPRNTRGHLSPALTKGTEERNHCHCASCLWPLN
jgi:hypothetical protein